MNKYIASIAGLVLVFGLSGTIYGLQIKNEKGQTQPRVEKQEEALAVATDPTSPLITSVPTLDENVIRKIITEEMSKLPPTMNFPTLDSVDPEKEGFQEIYLPGSFINGMGTFFTAANISADTLTAAGANVGSLSATGGVDAEGDINAGGTIRTQHLLVGSTDDRTGITVYDRATGEAICIFSENGIVQAESGVCNNP